MMLRNWDFQSHLGDSDPLAGIISHGQWAPKSLGSRAISHNLPRPHEVHSVDWEAPVLPQEPFHGALTQSAKQLRGYLLPCLINSLTQRLMRPYVIL